jgi:hypothetical protein
LGKTVNAFMKSVDEGFYKKYTAVSLADYEKAESENCNRCNYREGCFIGDIIKK